MVCRFDGPPLPSFALPPGGGGKNHIGENMKKSLLIATVIILLGCFTPALPTTFEFGVGLSNAEAAQITLAWDVNPANSGLVIAGHTLRYWEVSDPATVYTKTVDGLTLTATVPVPAGDWRFTVDCFTAEVPSAQSAEINHVVDAYVPPADNLPVDDPAPDTATNFRKL